MINIQNDDTYEDDAPKLQRQIRKCLRCQKPFESEWIGERICKRCKNSGVWRQGLTTNVSNKRNPCRTTPTASDH